MRPTDDPSAPDAPDDPERTIAARDAAPPAPSSNVLPAGTQLAEFNVTGVIGEGGFGVVYRAHDRALQRTVAIKEYMPGALAARLSDARVTAKSEQHRATFETGLRSFINEARLLAQFDHPALVRVFRFWSANGTAYMAMPLYEGGTLKQTLLGLGRPPDEAWLRRLLAPLLDAIELLHAADCLHRDIAPDNILMGPASTAQDPRPVLLDFGAARRVIGEQTQALTVILKPGYAPIEQYDEIPGMKQGPWTDLYALGAVLHFAIMGRPPPPSVGRLVHDAWVPLARAAAGRYSEGFLAAIDAVLAARPQERPRSVAQWRALLDGTHAWQPLRAEAGAMRTTAAPARAAGESLSSVAALATSAAPARLAAPAAPTALAATAAGARTASRGAKRLALAIGAGALAASALVLALAITLGGRSREPQAPAQPGEPVAAAHEPGAPAQARAAPNDGAGPPSLPAAAAPTRDALPADTAAPEAAPRTPARPGIGTGQIEAPQEKSAPREPASPPAQAVQRAPVSPPAHAARRDPVSPSPANETAPAAPIVVPPATAAFEATLREARDCLAARQYACTIARAEAVLKADPESAAAQALLKAARAGQEAALGGDWKMR
jgi:hypothetical protein